MSRSTADVEERLHPTGPVEVFDPAMLEGLPEPAQRYLRRAIAPGTPLARWVDLDMVGRMRTAEGQPWMELDSHAVVASPKGFLWRAEVHRGLMRLRGHDLYVDGHGEMLWKLWGLVPVVRAAGAAIDRSAAGRTGFESVFLPSSLLPCRGARWEAAGPDTAVVHMDVDGLDVHFAVTVDDLGRLVHTEGPRERGDADPPVVEPFGVVQVLGEQTWGGYTLPSHVVVGWRPAAPDAFPFFDVEVHTVVHHT